MPKYEVYGHIDLMYGKVLEEPANTMTPCGVKHKEFNFDFTSNNDHEAQEFLAKQIEEWKKTIQESKITDQNIPSNVLDVEKNSSTSL